MRWSGWGWRGWGRRGRCRGHIGAWRALADPAGFRHLFPGRLRRRAGASRDHAFAGLRLGRGNARGRRDVPAIPAKWWRLALLFFAIIASHGLLNAPTKGGFEIPFFWPLGGRWGDWGPIPASTWTLSYRTSDRARHSTPSSLGLAPDRARGRPGDALAPLQPHEMQGFHGVTRRRLARRASEGKWLGSLACALG